MHGILNYINTSEVTQKTVLKYQRLKTEITNSVNIFGCPDLSSWNNGTVMNT